MADAPDELRQADEKKIRAACAAVHFSLANLCTSAGIDRSTLTRVFTQKVRISTIKKIADKLGVTPDSLEAGPAEQEHQDKKTEAKHFDVNIGRFNVRVSTAKNFTKDRLRTECELLGHAIYIHCDLHDGWTPDDLNPESGSAMFTMRLSPMDTKKVLMSFADGDLAQFDVVSITSAIPTPAAAVPASDVTSGPGLKDYVDIIGGALLVAQLIPATKNSTNVRSVGAVHSSATPTYEPIFSLAKLAAGMGVGEEVLIGSAREKSPELPWLPQLYHEVVMLLAAGNSYEEIARQLNKSYKTTYLDVGTIWTIAIHSWPVVLKNAGNACIETDKAVTDLPAE